MAPTEGRVATAVGLTPRYPRKYSENFHTTPYHAYGDRWPIAIG